MNPIQETFHSFTYNTPSTAFSFSEALKRSSSPDLDPVKKRWYKICYELVQEPETVSDAFKKRLEKIQRLLEAPPRSEVRSTAAEEVFDFVVTSSTSLQLEMRGNILARLNAPGWVKLATKFLQRVMQGVYGPNVRSKLLKNAKNILTTEITRLLSIDLILRQQDPIVGTCDALAVTLIKQKIAQLSQKLSSNFALPCVAINELLIKDVRLFSPSLKSIEVDDAAWNLIRPYIDPSDEQLHAIALSQATYFPQKAFSIACRITERRSNAIADVLHKIALEQLDIALDLMEPFRARDLPLFAKCSFVIAKTMLEKMTDSDAALPHIREVLDDSDLIELAPSVVQKLNKKHLPAFLSQAQSLESKAEIIEIVAKHSSLNDAQGFIDALSDPYLKDLAISSQIATQTRQQVSLLSRLFQKIQDPEVRMNTLERLAIRDSRELQKFAQDLTDKRNEPIWCSLLRSISENSSCHLPIRKSNFSYNNLYV